MSNKATTPRTASVHQAKSDADRRAELVVVLNSMHAGEGAFAPMSWRQIARTFPFNITNATNLRRYANGDPVVDDNQCAAFGLQPYIKAPACPTCGGACTFDCGTQRPVNIGQPRKLSRCTIYPGTAVDKIVADVYRVTGLTLAVVDAELPY